MINLWILRIKLWWYEVCPEHGYKRGFVLCQQCNEETSSRRAMRTKRLQSQYRMAKFKGREDALEDNCHGSRPD